MRVELVGLVTYLGGLDILAILEHFYDFFFE